MHDFFSLTSKITPQRFWNAWQILMSYYTSRNSGILDLRGGLPVSIAIEPTTSCNLRCPQCPSGLRSFTRPTGMLETGLYKKIIDELSDTLIYLTFYFQGEPYLNPRFLDMVAYASKKRIYTSTSTNGHYLNENNVRETIASGLSRLIISIDGTTQESYQAYRVGGKLDVVLNGLRNLVKWKKILKSHSPYILLQFIVFRHNEHQVTEIKELARELGVDIQIKTAQIYDYENGSDLIPEDSSFSRYQMDNIYKYKIDNELQNQCWRMWQSCVITWDGKVVPCCFDKDATYKLGDLQHMSFYEIWNSKPYNRFRTGLLKSRKEIDICSNCSEGTKVFV